MHSAINAAHAPPSGPLAGIHQRFKINSPSRDAINARPTVDSLFDARNDRVRYVLTVNGINVHARIRNTFDEAINSFPNSIIISGLANMNTNKEMIDAPTNKNPK